MRLLIVLLVASLLSACSSLREARKIEALIENEANYLIDLQAMIDDTNSSPFRATVDPANLEPSTLKPPLDIYSGPEENGHAETEGERYPKPEREVLPKFVDILTRLKALVRSDQFCRLLALYQELIAKANETYAMQTLHKSTSPQEWNLRAATELLRKMEAETVELRLMHCRETMGAAKVSMRSPRVGSIRLALYP